MAKLSQIKCLYERGHRKYDEAIWMIQSGGGGGWEIIGEEGISVAHGWLLDRWKRMVKLLRSIIEVTKTRALTLVQYLIHKLVQV